MKELAQKLHKENRSHKIISPNIALCLYLANANANFSQNHNSHYSRQDKLQVWTGHFTLICKNLKPVDISKNHYNNYHLNIFKSRIDFQN